MLRRRSGLEQLSVGLYVDASICVWRASDNFIDSVQSRRRELKAASERQPRTSSGNDGKLACNFRATASSLKQSLSARVFRDVASKVVVYFGFVYAWLSIRHAFYRNLSSRPGP
jgi:hypothetical protein